MSLEQLRERAGVACSANSLSRKLRNKQPMSTGECELLARALDVVLIVDGRTHPDEAAVEESPTAEVA